MNNWNALSVNSLAEPGSHSPIPVFLRIKWDKCEQWSVTLTYKSSSDENLQGSLIYKTEKPRDIWLQFRWSTENSICHTPLSFPPRGTEDVPWSRFENHGAPQLDSTMSSSLGAFILQGKLGLLLHPWKPWQAGTCHVTPRNCVWRSIFWQKSFPGGSEVKNPSANAGDPGSIPELGRSPGEGIGDPLQYSCLGNSMDRGAWQATVHGVAKESDKTEQVNNFGRGWMFWC